MANYLKNLAVIMVIAFSWPSLAFAQWQATLAFYNCTPSNLNVIWDAYKYNVDTPWENQRHADGSFVIPSRSGDPLGLKKVTLFIAANDIYNDGQINFRFDSPSGPAWIHIDNSQGTQIVTVKQGNIEIFSNRIATITYNRFLINCSQ